MAGAVSTGKRGSLTGFGTPDDVVTAAGTAPAVATSAALQTHLQKERAQRHVAKLAHDTIPDLQLLNIKEVVGKK